MSTRRVRPLALLLAALVLLTGTSPTLANDPAPDPSAPPVEGPSVHAEMLDAHADEPYVFAEGAAPQALAAPTLEGGTMSLDDGTDGAGGTGGIAALPNGLSHEVFGYLPYWYLDASDLANMRYDLVSTIAYFGLVAARDGTIDKTSGTNGAAAGWAGWTSSAMTDVISRSHQRGVRVVLTVTMFAWDYDYSDMSALLKSSTRRARLVDAIASTVKSRNADGVNVDFEPVPTELKSQFTTFVHELKAGLKAAGAGSYVTVATMAGAASWSTGYDLAGLTASGGADALMVMAYDFNYGGSARAGGVAPHVSPYVLDATSALEAHLRLVPASKLIWGVPYYGRRWSTTTSTLYSRTCISSGTCTKSTEAWTYVGMQHAAGKYGREWDGTGKVPWYRYHDGTLGAWVQGYYDDAVSLKHKYGLVKGNGLRGAGIWHLLMDGSRTELWETLYTQFGPLPFTDIADSEFVMDIVWLADEGITTGCNATRFCPKEPVSRGQMASFLARALHLPRSTRDHFRDDDGLVHENAINRVAEAGITVGCAKEKYCPHSIVKRDQMASFLARALSLPQATRDWFTDDAGNEHEANINRLKDARITTGCASTKYCPTAKVKREQMAAFLRRAVGS